MNLSETRNSTIIPTSDILTYTEMGHIHWLAIPFWLEELTVSETVIYVRNKFKRILCGCEHHLISMFYSTCRHRKNNTACGHRDIIRGTIEYLYGLITVLWKKYHLPLATDDEMQEIREKIDRIEMVSDFDSIGQRYGHSGDLTWDIRRVKEAQNTEAQMIEEILHFLTNRLEEAFLLDTKLIILAWKSNETK